MRKTLILAGDVAAKLHRIQKSRKASFKDVVNEVLREGLKHLSEPKLNRIPYRTESASLVRCLIEGIDDVSEAIAAAEGNASR
ncbi:MAG: hypothetical protein HYT87_18215 [Nitrospirae bacterium]|nr:hypothetical protein [Nitrospirota bacterium]